MTAEGHPLVFLRNSKAPLCKNARRAIEALELEMVDGISKGFELYLGYEDAYFLIHYDGVNEMRFNLDFAEGAIDYRRRFGQRGGQLLVKAVGGSKKVFDATAGLGRDLFILASHGIEVFAVEKSPVVGLLLEDALVRAKGDEKLKTILPRIHFEVGDSVEKLKAMPEGNVDCIYLDPMFPTSKKKALPKKELQILQVLTRMGGDDHPSGDLLAEARAKCQRVVVKRPAHGAPLAPGVSAVLKGSSIRFDIYFR